MQTPLSGMRKAARRGTQEGSPVVREHQELGRLLLAAAAGPAPGAQRVAQPLQHVRQLGHARRMRRAHGCPIQGSRIVLFQLPFGSAAAAARVIVWLVCALVLLCACPCRWAEDSSRTFQMIPKK